MSAVRKKIINLVISQLNLPYRPNHHRSYRR